MFTNIRLVAIISIMLLSWLLSLLVCIASSTIIINMAVIIIIGMISIMYS